jgi:hypothetical protein
MFGYLEDGIMPTFTHEESALFERNPNREICIEIAPSLEQSRCGRDGVGLLVDVDQTELVRMYAEDSWTELQDDGYSVRAPSVDEDECWGSFVDSGWENARKVYDSIPADEREGWAEGVVARPVYSAIIIKGHMDVDMLFKAAALKKIFGLPVVRL